MNISTKLITQQYIKDTTVVQQLVADINLDAFILQTQDFYLRPTLGVDLYNSLINDFNANSGYTSSAFTGNNYSILLDYCKPYLAYQTIYEAFPYFSIKIANAGLIRRTGGGDYEPISHHELQYFRNDIYSKGNNVKTLLIGFLNDNKSIYYVDDIQEDTCNSNNRKNLGGIYF